MIKAKYTVGDKVSFYGWPARIEQVEVRAAGFPDYFIEVYGQGTDHTWAQENELEDANDLHTVQTP